jgi:septal ring-binding cell division protein DamX
MSTKKWMVCVVAAALTFALAAAPMATSAFAQTGPTQTDPTQVPQSASGGVNWPGAGYGAAALLGNIFYIPAKLVYAVAGTFVGGASYLITAGNLQTSETIWRSSLGGDWVLTPDMVAGNQPLNFSGPTQTAPVPPMTAATPMSPVTAAPAPMPASSSAPTSSSSSSYRPLDGGSGPVRSTSRSSSRLPEMTIE